MPLQQTSGNVTADAYGGGTAVEPVYIEQIFSTYLYTGNGSTQTINNGIDLAGKGGLVWIKNRTAAAAHYLFDTARGADYTLNTNTTSAQGAGWSASGFFNPGFLSTGFGIGSDSTLNGANNYASWTFRKQPKFFDVVTGTTDASGNCNFAHSLASVPGCVVFKFLNDADNWVVYHQGMNGGTNPKRYWNFLNLTNAQSSQASDWISLSSTNVSTTGGFLYWQNKPFVAYLFAHNAGGFGLTGTDNVISCGSYTGTGSATGPTVTLGYEPQWLLVKKASGAQDWFLFDNMRGVATGGNDYYLLPNSSNAETTGGNTLDFTATGFVPMGQFDLNTSGTYIYIAIRRGPMKVPTTGTSVYNAITRTGTGANAVVNNVGFPPDLSLGKARNFANGSTNVVDRLRGNTQYLQTGAITQEFSVTDAVTSFNMNGVSLGPDAGLGDWNTSGFTFVEWHYQRAPGFFDEVCYTGNAGTNTINHNLTVVPELVITKPRSTTGDWIVWNASIGANELLLNSNLGNIGSAVPTRTSTTVNLTGAVDGNSSGVTYAMYLFATCAGVSKVGTYTGNGTTQTIACGFTGGSRLVLIKRTDSTGNWVIWDTARGMVAGTDPYLQLNTTNAEVNANWVYTTTGGFQIVTSNADVNASGGSYIYFSVA